MKLKFLLLLIVLSAAVSPSLVGAADLINCAISASVVRSDNAGIRLQFNASDHSGNQSSDAGATQGIVKEYGQPELPMVSNFVVVPGDAGIEFEFHSLQPRRVRPESAPALSEDEGLLAQHASFANVAEVFPPVAAEISEPFVIRGVRLVKVTTYPVQFDHRTGEFIHNDRITTTINFTDAEPINPVAFSFRQHQSSEFRKFIKALAINGDEVARDDAGGEATVLGHYLIATNENCLQYIAPFIEWRRKAGYRVDILSIPNNIAESDTAEIKARIQAYYDAALQDGEEPFDQLLLVGDRDNYLSIDDSTIIGPAAGWKLAAPRAVTTWPQGAPHADYKYACLEGDDNYPDVGFSRFCAGADSVLKLFVGRTLAYEATPDMTDISWFTRGAVYSQHWGNDPESSAWHVSIASNLRWGQQLLKSRGFDDVRFFEDYAHDGYGGTVGRFERQQLEDGINLMLGRAEVMYWRDQAPPPVSTTFPIRLTFSGHGEYFVWPHLRKGTGVRMRGAVAATCGWGNPTTTISNAIWLENVNALVNRKLNFGWSRLLATTVSENYFNNFFFSQYRVYETMKTDYDYYGDPGLVPWFGVPKVVRATFPASLAPEARRVEVTVSDTTARHMTAGATVTLYAPGDLPDFDDGAYADYNGMQMWSMTTDASGKAIFVFDETVEFQNETPLYVTITGPGIRPYFGQIGFDIQNEALEVESYALTEIAGNGDAFANPGEEFELAVTAQNPGRNRIDQVIGELSSTSPYISLSDTARITFGDMVGGAHTAGQNRVRLQINSNCPDGVALPELRPAITVRFRSNNQSWYSAIVLDPHAPHLMLETLPDGNVVPAEGTLELDPIVRNNGRLASGAFVAKLWPMGSSIDVVRDSVTFSSIAAGASGTCEGQPFTARVVSTAIPGSMCRMLLKFENEPTFVDSSWFSLQVVTARANAPQAPDAHGYICYDNTDQGWNNKPDYAWIEINPADQNSDLDGTRLEFTGQSAEDAGEAFAIPLPFKSGLYGHLFDTLTVCSNGYLMPGNQSRVINPQNWPLDRAMGGGVGMIAPLWDWLKMAQFSGVYYHVDAEMGRVIVEFNRLQHRTGNESELTFQVILYDRDRWARESGDPDIIFQYKSVEDVEGTEAENADLAYASVGISSPDGTVGSAYVFRNQYPVSNAPLADRRAILYSTSIHDHEGIVYGHVRAEEGGNPISGARVRTHYGLEVMTDGQGYFRLPRVVQGDKFSMMAGRDGYTESVRADLDMTNRDSLEVNFVLSISDVPNEPEASPLSFALVSAYPNPFNSSVTINFALDQPGEVKLMVYTLNGRQVASLVEGTLSVANHSIRWNAEGMPAGLYLVRLESLGRSNVQKLLLVK